MNLAAPNGNGPENSLRQTMVKQMNLPIIYNFIYL